MIRECVKQRFATRGQAVEGLYWLCKRKGRDWKVFTAYRCEQGCLVGESRAWHFGHRIGITGRAHPYRAELMARRDRQ